MTDPSSAPDGAAAPMSAPPPPPPPPPVVVHPSLPAPSLPSASLPSACPPATSVGAIGGPLLVVATPHQLRHQPVVFDHPPLTARPVAPPPAAAKPPSSTPSSNAPAVAPPFRRSRAPAKVKNQTHFPLEPLANLEGDAASALSLELSRSLSLRPGVGAPIPDRLSKSKGDPHPRPQTLYCHPKYPSLVLYDDTSNAAAAVPGAPPKRSWRYCRRDNNDFLRFSEIVLAFEGIIEEQDLVRNAVPKVEAPLPVVRGVVDGACGASLPSPVVAQNYQHLHHHVQPEREKLASPSLPAAVKQDVKKEEENEEVVHQEQQRPSSPPETKLPPTTPPPTVTSAEVAPRPATPAKSPILGATFAKAATTPKQVSPTKGGCNGKPIANGPAQPVAAAATACRMAPSPLGSTGSTTDSSSRESALSREEDENDDVVATTATSAEPDGDVYCICRKPDDGGLMISCDGCEKWFHAHCVDYSDDDEGHGGDASDGGDDDGGEKRVTDDGKPWFCPDCRGLERKKPSNAQPRQRRRRQPTAASRRRSSAGKARKRRSAGANGASGGEDLSPEKRVRRRADNNDGSSS